jgi:tyrosine-protein phosphatase SIW14
MSITLVDDGILWRGSRPEAADFASIQSRFSTVISLEGMEENHMEALELAPVPVVSHPISAWQIYFSGITQIALASILLSIKLAKKPVLVHCQHGQDRTGLVIAAYRVRVLGWAKQAAWNEALQYGYRDWLNFGLNQTWENL